MELHCDTCGANTRHNFIGANPDNEKSLYSCLECDERQEIEEVENKLSCLHPDKNFCGECDNCIEWDRTFDHEGFEEQKRARIAEQNEY